MTKEELARLIGNNVRTCRMNRKMTQNELAMIVGKNASAITRIEGGTRMMSISLLRDFSIALCVSTDTLLFNESATSHLQNILMLLSRQTDDNLVRIERLINVLVEEFGSQRADSPQL